MNQSQAQLPIVATETAIDISQLQRRQARAERRQRLADFLDAIYATEYGSEEKEQFDRLWTEQSGLWLQQLPSAHTRRAYSNAVIEFRAYMWNTHAVRHLWLVEPHHAIQWLDFMRTIGNAMLDDPKPVSDRTANQRLAALSSFFEHMIGATKLIHGDQVGLFVSADGYPRQNPFRSGRVKRPKVQPYGNSNPIPQEVISGILRAISHKEEKSLADRRDFALFTTFAFTGYRADSVLSMRWGDFQARADGEGMTFNWRGKGGKERRKAVPPRVWAAITAYLRSSGRFIPGHLTPEPDMYIWQGISTSGTRNLIVHQLIEQGYSEDVAQKLADGQMADYNVNKPITQSTALKALRRRLQRYYTLELRSHGLSHADASAEAKRMAAAYHLHSLRHTFANLIDQASDGDIRLVSELLDHSSIETTRTYLEKIRDPEDKATALLEKMFGF